MSLRLAATGLFGVAILLPPLSATLSAIIGFVLMWMSLTVSASDLQGDRALRFIAIAFAAIALVLGFDRGSLAAPAPAGVTGFIVVASVIVMLGLMIARGRSTVRLAVWVGVGVLLILSIEVMVTFGGNLYGLDPYRSHESAADAVLAGENPYSAAVLVEDGSPNADPGSLIEGYSYPPVTLMAYVAGDLLGGDPRWASVLGIFVVLGIATVVGRGSPRVLAAVLVVLLAVPVHRAIIWSGWTEPVSLALLVAGVALWRKPTASAVVLGFALASKQYLIVLVPLLVLVDTRPWRRSFTTVGVAALTLVPSALVSFSLFWSAIVERPLGLGFRPDTGSIAGAAAQLGFELQIPTWLMPVVVLGLTLVLAKKVTTQSDVFACMAVVLAVTFLMSLAFANYWWLVQWLAAFSVIAAASELNERSPIRSGV